MHYEKFYEKKKNFFKYKLFLHALHLEDGVLLIYISHGRCMRLLCKLISIYNLNYIKWKT